ncbi:DUF3488 domain-containing protein [Pseudoxanthomonas gei]|uniref:DUF3488 domain-containing protein n=1 Tax=Pseudoxanthomonas gei TaxID=1383030 RepID=A0ABX0A886_9GAMM|nr:DUF3488 and transglutaminase-like domain-containing protein [Pseudoxanthomonas gei]NDK37722.1 DUF3488 domain-containing protein [Pseudoxanthomonas gei]
MVTDVARDRIDKASRLWTLATAGLSLMPLLLQLPGGLALAIVTAALLATAVAWRKPMPAGLRLLLALVVVAAVLWKMEFRLGRDTGCALLAAMIAIKPSETSTLRDARSMVGFALFAPFSAFLLDQGPMTMLLGLLAVLCALVALQRLAAVESSSLAGSPSAAQQLLAVGKLVGIGLPLVLTVFWLFPRLGSPLWGIPGRALGRPGLSDQMTPGGWLDMMADDRPAMRVEFFGPAPSQQQMYWRGPVLWDFDGRSWTQPRWIRGLPAKPIDTGNTRWDYQIEFEPTDRRQLVALDLPMSAPAGSFLSSDYGLYAASPLSALTRWRLQSSPPTRFQPQLEATLRQHALALPAGYNPRTLALARQWRSETGDDDAALVRRALAWVTSDFAYTLDTPLPGRDGVDEFLFDQKQGYCQHFSSSFVVLMRAAGIPSRVVTGFAGGVRNSIGGYWVVRNMDAHAWAEVWLPERGWVRVDPTAAVAPERIYDTLEDRLTAGSGALGQLDRLGDFSDWMRRGWNDLVLGFNADRQQRLLQSFGIEHLGGSRLGMLLGVFAMLALAWMGWLLARGERQRDPLLRAWHRLDRRYARLGLQRQPDEPALRWAERVARERPEAAGTLVSLSRRFAAARYARGVGDAALLNDLRRHRP